MENQQFVNRVLPSPWLEKLCFATNMSWYAIQTEKKLFMPFPRRSSFAKCSCRSKVGP